VQELRTAHNPIDMTVATMTTTAISQKRPQGTPYQLDPDQVCRSPTDFSDGISLEIVTDSEIIASPATARTSRDQAITRRVLKAESPGCEVVGFRG